MQLETHQLYALFAMCVITAILIGLSYVTGLRTGRAAGYGQGREAAARYWKGLLKGLKGEQTELRGMLAREEQLTDSIRSQLNTLRTALHQEQAEHNTIVQDLLDELQRQRGNFTLYDCQALRRAARLLGHAADMVRKSGTTKTNQAAEAQSQVTDIADRLHTILTAPKLMAQMAESCITDTDMIEWLEREATYHGEPETGELRFPVVTPEAGLPSLRDILQLAIEQHHAREQGRSTWERVDAEVQPAAAMCA
ncbi:hypothetical protein GNE00_15105 [Pseudomonas sp. JL972]|uniref:hypothetical protein n=1 Tax=Stutzerimonas degradans TaxID=2968968 RepID=UPI0012D8CC79|nr:hypothetical protein [Stutzerimonas degradans]MTZ15079.1 hypothetical protein [Stutzerimonas degradans]